VSDEKESSNPHEQRDVLAVSDRNGGKGDGAPELDLGKASLGELRERFGT
jgi:hypothetical protein